MRYQFNHIETAYDFSSVVTFANGQRSAFHKVEHVEARMDGNDYSFLMKGSSDETLNGVVPEEFDAIILEFGKALYPIDLRISDQGEFIAVNDFEGLKEHWLARRKEIVDYYNSYLIEKESNKYALALKTEEKFFNTLKENMLYKLLFWREEEPVASLGVRDFPSRARISTFVFQGRKVVDGFSRYDTYDFRDEGSGRLLGGHATLRIGRDDDGLPSEIGFQAKVEEQDTGYFTKEITIKRI